MSGFCLSPWVAFCLSACYKPEGLADACHCIFTDNAYQAPVCACLVAQIWHLGLLKAPAVYLFSLHSIMFDVRRKSSWGRRLERHEYECQRILSYRESVPLTFGVEVIDGPCHVPDSFAPDRIPGKRCDAQIARNLQDMVKLRWQLRQFRASPRRSVHHIVRIPSPDRASRPRPPQRHRYPGSSSRNPVSQSLPAPGTLS